MARQIIPYNEARLLIQDGDILLFRGKGIISHFIKWASKGEYSHVALASWYKDTIECVEFREFKGGRTVALRRQVNEFPDRIDVYRVSKNATLYKVQENKVVETTVEYNPQIAVDRMRELTGLPYGWSRIWKLAKYHVPFLRWFNSVEFEDKSNNGGVYPVCSTAVAAAIRLAFFDVFPNLSDNEIAPSDVARCSHLHYLFTLGK